eukprot:7263835-Ditylum_brightwellii.AAC.1
MAWWMVRARGTTNEVMAEQCRAKRPNPLRDSGSVARTNALWGRQGVLVSVRSTSLVVLFMDLGTAECHWKAPLKEVSWFALRTSVAIRKGAC